MRGEGRGDRRAAVGRVDDDDVAGSDVKVVGAR